MAEGTSMLFQPFYSAIKIIDIIAKETLSQTERPDVSFLAGPSSKAEFPSIDGIKGLISVPLVSGLRHRCALHVGPTA